jgi:type II secretory pathway component PulC
MRAGTGILPVVNARVDSRDHHGHEIRTWPTCSFAAAQEQEARRAPVARAWPSRLQIVGILAFIQSLLFLVIWLWICASAGAATPPKADFSLDLQQSRYDPVQQRDPFGRTGGVPAESKAAPAAPLVFHLSGILYQATNPSAVVNDKLLTLNKTVTLNAGNGEVQIKAVEITRDRVVLEVGGQKVELRMNSHNQPAAQP